MTATHPWERVERIRHARAAAGSAAVAVVWVVLAVSRPHMTFHIAPFFVAAIWPWRLRNGTIRVGPVDARVGAFASASFAVGVGSLLLTIDALRGPTLWGGTHAIVEVIPAAIAGAVVGYRHARCGPPLT